MNRTSVINTTKRGNAEQHIHFSPFADKAVLYMILDYFDCWLWATGHNRSQPGLSGLRRMPSSSATGEHCAGYVPMRCWNA